MTLKFKDEFAREIKELLTTHPQLRDDYCKLYATVWHNEIGDERLKTMTALEFLRFLYNNSNHKKLTKPNTIGRLRREIQELYPELSTKSKKKKFYQEVQTIREIERLKREL